jgi:hypothetical protein
VGGEVVGVQPVGGRQSQRGRDAGEEGRKAELERERRQGEQG